MKEVIAVSRDSYEDPMSIIIERMVQDGKSFGQTPVYIMEEPNEELVYMSYEPFSLQEARAAQR